MTRRFVKIGAVKTHFTERRNWISVSTSHPYYSIWLKFHNKGLNNNYVEHL